MKIKFYFTTTVLMIIALMQDAKAQNNNNLPDSIYITETFGTGANKAALPAGRTTYSYNGTSSLNDGDYMMYKNTAGRPEWHSASDHTGNNNGRAMVINAGLTAAEFYRDTIFNVISGVNYSMYLYVMNVNTLGTCGSSALLPKLQFIIESYNQTTHTFTQITNFSTGFIPQTSAPTWFAVGGSFQVPAGVTALRYRILNNSSGGCGNDLAIDDITFARANFIPSTLPVTGLEASVLRSGENVSVQWQTLTENNTRNFIVEKSFDAASWTTLDSVTAAGYSANKRTYASADSKPGSVTYYRIKQVDNNGHYTYSNTVRIAITSNTLDATTFPNPFVSQVQVDVNSPSIQKASVTFSDLSGRKIIQKAWSLSKGKNSIVLQDVQQLPVGIYMLNIINEDGVIVYKTKLIKK